MKSNIYSDTWFNPTRKELDDDQVESIFAFDLDSVLNEMGMSLGKYVADALGCPCEEVHNKTPEGALSFHFGKEGVPDEEISALVNRYILEESPSLLPTPFMAEVIDYVWASTLQPITVITYRPEETMEVTYNWLKENMPAQVPFRLIIVNGMPKHVVLKRIRAEVFVDDRYKTVQMLEQDINLSILYKRPWNQGRSVEAGDVTIEDLRGLIPIVNILARRHIMSWPGHIPYPNRIGMERIEYA